jgi:very-short-patch-repair endonuclease
LPAFAKSLQAAQLALAIDPHRLCLVLAESGRKPDAANRLGFARAAEWLARQTQARVAALVPEAVADSPALESISFETARACVVAPAPTSEEKQSLLVLPFYGNPHPDSPGEQLLARQLDRDSQLSGRFLFNHRIQSVRGSYFTVDLLCDEARLVVEVDGYGWHSAPRAFRQDRHRDYELSLTGYLVLRLTHDEVIEDVHLAIEKIRDMVAYRCRER